MTEPTHRDRVTVVTGAARGIGQAIAEGLAARGARVAAVDLRDAGETARAIEKAGGECAALVCDVASPRDVGRLVGEVHTALGPCEILVNNAALLVPPAPIDDVDYDLWRRVLTVNLDSQFLMAKAFLPDMVARRWGRIVNVASTSIYTATRGLVPYMASKGGVMGLTSGLANDVAQHGITVNAVSPALTRTPAVDEAIATGALTPEALDATAEMQAIKRRGSPQDVVGAVCFLTSDDAYFVTGQLLAADGGLTRR